MTTARERFLAFRRSLPRTPKLTRHTVRARGLDFAVFTTPPVEGSTQPPLVCINGGLIYPHTLLWPALSPLAARRQLVLYDQRGRGHSQAPPGVRAARIEHDAGDVRAIREALDIPQWDVLGHSWGGGVAMLATARDADAVRALVLVDSVGMTSDWLPGLVPAARKRLSEADGLRLERLELDLPGSEEPFTHSEYARVLYPAWFADRDLAGLFSPPTSTSRTGAVIASRLKRDGYDWRAELRALPVPSLVIHGAEDLLPTALAEATARALGNATVSLVAGAGHMPFWEAPEQFFPLVDTFLLAPPPRL